MVVPKHGHGPDHFDARRVSGDDDDALLFVMVAIVRVRLSHDEVEAATWVAGATYKPWRR